MWDILTWVGYIRQKVNSQFFSVGVLLEAGKMATCRVKDLNHFDMGHGIAGEIPGSELPEISRSRGEFLVWWYLSKVVLGRTE